jgi:hypothetical protein
MVIREVPAPTAAKRSSTDARSMPPLGPHPAARPLRRMHRLRWFISQISLSLSLWMLKIAN